MLDKLEKRLKEEADSEKAKQLQRFFKTGAGEYGEGDIFLGIVVPKQRAIVKEFKELTLDEIQKLLDSEIHEKRLIALLILIEKYKKAVKTSMSEEKKKIFDFYLRNTKRINNWDLVDLSALHIIGGYLLDKERKIIYKLAGSENLWERRIAVLSCFAFIRENDFVDALNISELLLKDSEDLIHKAVGWMLREIGKRDKRAEEEFLNKHYRIMPRTMLRYAIEKFPEEKRKFYLGI